MRSYLKLMRSKKLMAKHVFNAHFVGPRISWRREQAQAKKGPCGPTKGSKMKQSYSPKRSQQEAWKWATSPCSSLVHPLPKKQLEPPIRGPSLWGWIRGCPINFLPPFTWREQYPRVVILAKVKTMKGLHHLPQDYTSSGRGAEIKLSKFQQIDVINVKKRSRRDSCAKLMNPKGEKIGNMWFGGHKGISNGTIWSGFKLWHLVWGVESYFLGSKSQLQH